MDLAQTETWILFDYYSLVHHFIENFGKNFTSLAQANFQGNVI